MRNRGADVDDGSGTGFRDEESRSTISCISLDATDRAAMTGLLILSAASARRRWLR
jgi:hypothetical protein